MERQSSLFPAEIELEEQWLEDKCKPYYLPLWQMIRDAFDDMNQRRLTDEAFQYMRPGELAQWLRPQIVRHAEKRFAGTGVTIERKRQQLFLLFPDEFLVTPKKFRSRGRDKGLTFSSYDTLQNSRYWKQQHCDGIPMLPRVLVGYQFVLGMTDIKIWVAYPYGKKITTCYLMPDQTGAIISQMVVHTVADEAAEDRGFEVKPKTDVQANAKIQSRHDDTSEGADRHVPVRARK